MTHGGTAEAVTATAGARPRGYWALQVVGWSVITVLNITAVGTVSPRMITGFVAAGALALAGTHVMVRLMERLPAPGPDTLDVPDAVFMRPTVVAVFDNVGPPRTEVPLDCDQNDVLDVCDILDGTIDDCNGSGVPDSCETLPDSDGDGIPDDCDLCPFGDDTIV